MNNDIKEVLEHLSATQKINNGWTSFSVEECKCLYNYTTNLQEENRILKEMNVCVGCENNPTYKKRIDKAVELCDNLLNNDIVIIKGKEYYKQEADNIITQFIKDTLIGSDKE